MGVVLLELLHGDLLGVILGLVLGIVGVGHLGECVLVVVRIDSCEMEMMVIKTMNRRKWCSVSIPEQLNGSNLG